MRSVRVVFPESICADTPILRWYFKRWRSTSVSWNLWASEGGGVSLAACDGNFTAAAAAAEAWRRATDNGRKSALRARQSEKLCAGAGRRGRGSIKQSNWPHLPNCELPNCRKFPSDSCGSYTGPQLPQYCKPLRFLSSTWIQIRGFASSRYPGLDSGCSLALRSQSCSRLSVYVLHTLWTYNT